MVAGLYLIVRCEWDWCCQWYLPLLASYRTIVFLAYLVCKTDFWSFLYHSLASSWVLNLLDVTGAGGWFVSCMPREADLLALLTSPEALGVSGVMLTIWAMLFKLVRQRHLEIMCVEDQAPVQSELDTLEHCSYQQRECSCCIVFNYCTT